MMIVDIQTYPICKQNLLKIGSAFSEEYGNKHRDTRFYELDKACLVSIRIKKMSMIFHSYFTSHRSLGLSSSRSIYISFTYLIVLVRSVVVK